MHPFPRSLSLAALVAISLTRSGFASGVAVDGKLISTAGSGAPLGVASSAVVASLNADRVDGWAVADLAQRLGNVVTVAKEGGDFSTVGAALASISDATGSNPYLVFVGPGLYACEPCSLRPHVLLAGAGIGLTTLEGLSVPEVLTSSESGPFSLRDLSVRGLLAGPSVAGISLGTSQSLQLLRVEVDVDGASDQVVGVRGRDMDLRDVVVRVLGTREVVGIRPGVLDSRARLTDVEVVVRNPAPEDPTKSTYGILTNAHLVLRRGRISVVSGGDVFGTYGLHFNGLDLELADTSISVRGNESSNTGIRVGNANAIRNLDRVEVEVNGGGMGVETIGPLAIRNTRIDVSGAASAIGIRARQSSYPVYVHQTLVRSDGPTVAASEEMLVLVAHSLLDGQDVTDAHSGSDIRCAWTLDGNLTELYPHSCLSP